MTFEYPYIVILTLFQDSFDDRLWLRLQIAQERKVTRMSSAEHAAADANQPAYFVRIGSFACAVLSSVIVILNEPTMGDAPLIASILIPLWVVAGRSLLLGIRVSGGVVTVRSWLRSVTFPAELVASVRVSPYSGLINAWDIWDTESTLWNPVFELLDGRRIPVRGSVGFRSNVSGRVDSLRRVLRLPRAGELHQVPKHRDSK